MVTVYCRETDNSYQITESLLDRLIVEGVIREDISNSYFPKYLFYKKDLAKVITKSM